MINTNLKLFFPVLFCLVLVVSITNIGVNYYEENFKPTGIEKLNPKTKLRLYAYIAGAVVNPGVYEITEDTKLVNLVEMAAGYSEDADLAKINNTLNLSQQIFNEDHIVVPFKVDDPIAIEGSENTDDLVSINNSTSEQLDSLPGIGEATVNKIIDNRPYKNIEELKEVEGIGEKKFESIKEFITL